MKNTIQRRSATSGTYVAAWSIEAPVLGWPLHAHLFDRFRVLRIVAECIDHRQELGALRVVDLADSQLVQRKKRNAPLPASEAIAAQGPIPKAAVH